MSFAEVILEEELLQCPIALCIYGTRGVQQEYRIIFYCFPNVFMNMAGGRVEEELLEHIWFLLVFFAGFTSAIAMYNYLTTIFQKIWDFQEKLHPLSYLHYIL